MKIKTNDALFLSDLENKIKNKLYVGQYFNNKMELYKLLELIPSDTKSINSNERQKINKILNAYIICDNSNTLGNSFIISEIFDRPQEILDKRKGKKYITYVETILLKYFLISSTDEIHVTYRQLFELLGLNNNNYYNQEERNKLYKSKSFSRFETNNFFIRSYSLMKRIVDSSLKSLSNRSKIWYTNNVIIVYPNNSLNDKIHVADSNEIQMILDIENLVLKEMKLNDKTQVFLKGKSSDFYDEVKSIIFDKYGWEDYYKEITIVPCSKKFLERAIEENIEEMKKTLNYNVVETMNINAKNIYDNQKKYYEEEWNKYKETKIFPDGIGLCSSFDSFVSLLSKNKIKYPDNYIEMQEILTKYFMSIIPEDQKDFIELLEKEKNTEEQNNDISLLE